MSTSSSIATPSAEQQLLLLRDVYARTGVLHEAQALQLRMWPMGVFEHAKETEARLNHTKKEIDFILKVDKKTEPSKEEMEKRCELLDKNVKWLLGEDWLVRVRVRKEVVYRGPRKAPVEKKEQPNDDGSNGPDGYGPHRNAPAE